MKVLIIGSHGFIGGYVCELFLRLGWEVMGIDYINMYKPAHYDLFLRHYEIRQKTQLAGLDAFYRIDCIHSSKVAAIINKHKPDIVINMAGLSVADVCKENTEEAVLSIYQANANILEALKGSQDVKRYVFISSSMVYGDFHRERPGEDEPKKPKDPYGAIKLGAELLIQSFQEQFALPYTIVRPSAVYGPLDSNMRVTGIFMLNAHLGQPLRVKDASEKLDFTYVEDAAEGIYLAATHPKAANEIFNITCGQGRTILELAKLIQKYYPKVEVITGSAVEYMEGLTRPIRGALNIEKAKRILGYKPRYTLELGMEKYVKRWREIYG
jgi:nucleoside-diphosphate-sugar epimerase